LYADFVCAWVQRELDCAIGSSIARFLGIVKENLVGKSRKGRASSRARGTRIILGGIACCGAAYRAPSGQTYGNDSRFTATAFSGGVGTGTQ